MTLSKAMEKTLAVFAFLVLVMYAGSSPALADTVELVDGNVLKGTVSTFTKGKLTVSTEYAKKNEVPVVNIKTISTDKAVTVQLTNDSILRGKLITQEDGQVAVILEPSGETVPIEWDQVKNINKPPGSWTGNFLAGGNIQNGNVDRTNVTVGFNARRDWERDRFTIRFLHNYGEDSGNLTSRNTFGSLKFDHLFTKKLYTALSLELTKDKFRDLKLRAVIGLSFGYGIWNDDVKTLEVELGAAYFSEDLDVGMDDQWATGRVGANFSYKIFENLYFQDYLLFYPSLENSEYRLRNQASLVSHLSQDWSLKLSHIFDQNSDPPMGIKSKDTQLIFALQYSF